MICAENNSAMPSIWIGCLLAFGLLLFGCQNATYRTDRRIPLVRATIEIDQWHEQKPSVSWSPIHSGPIPKGAKIVVQGPEPTMVTIYTEVTAGRTERVVVENLDDSPSEESDIIMRDATAWISEIERQFMDAGYRVVSRHRFHELLRDKSGTTQQDAAGLIGADYVVHINALEYRPRLLDPAQVNITLRHYTAAQDGTDIQLALEPRQYGTSTNIASSKVQSEPQTSDWFYQLDANANARGKTVMNIIRRNFMPVFSSVYLDAKIIQVETGEVINSYRSRRDHLLRHRDQVAYFFRPFGMHEREIFDPSQPTSRVPRSPVQVATIGLRGESGIRNASVDEIIRAACNAYIKSMMQRP